MEEVQDMKKTELCIHLAVPLACLLLLTGLFICRGFLYDPTELGTDAPVEQGSGNGKVDINTADADTLMLLPGIGSVTAEKIISYREKYGPFRKIEDIKKVSGIGDKTFEEIRKYIKVGG